MTHDELLKLLTAVQEGRVTPAHADSILNRNRPEHTAEPALPDNWEDVPIDRLGIHRSAVAGLAVAGIRTLGKLSSYTRNARSLLDIEGIDLKRSDEIGDKLAAFWKSHPEYHFEPSSENGLPTDAAREKKAVVNTLSASPPPLHLSEQSSQSESMRLIGPVPPPSPGRARDLEAAWQKIDELERRIRALERR
jgi:hypothetical protein